jgi:hypothetical protein
MGEDEKKEPIDTFNKFLVGMRGETIIIGMPPRTPLVREEALLLAAYLVALADPSGERFRRVLEAVEDT